MLVRLRSFLENIKNSFWFVPALLVGTSIVAAIALVELERAGRLSRQLLESAWLYQGGATGARTLLGAVAASTIGVAGTIFSITIAALSLTAGQMGPRLLRNFTRDRGNQFSLGVFLGTFSFALIVLRSVRVHEEGEFVPHLALTVAVLLAFASVATLVLFVGHMASRINVDTVIKLVSDDIRMAIDRILQDTEGDGRPPSDFWEGAAAVHDDRQGYLRELDAESLADWAEENGASILLLIRPGSFVFPGAAIGFSKPSAKGVEEAVRNATVLSGERVSASDIEYEIRQLVEVAVRALSPGINDPNTAMTVLDRLGAALCETAGRHLPTGVYMRDSRAVLVISAVTYDGLTDTMFHLIRQSAQAHAAVLIKMLEVLAAVLTCESNVGRQVSLKRHADLILADAKRAIVADDLADVLERHSRFCKIMRDGLPALIPD